MIAIWPAGPPKLINPSFNQKRKACPSVGFGAPLDAADWVRLSWTAPSIRIWTLFHDREKIPRRFAQLTPREASWKVGTGSPGRPGSVLRLASRFFPWLRAMSAAKRTREPSTALRLATTRRYTPDGEPLGGRRLGRPTSASRFCLFP